MTEAPPAKQTVPGEVATGALEAAGLAFTVAGLAVGLFALFSHTEVVALVLRAIAAALFAGQIVALACRRTRRGLPLAIGLLLLNLGAVVGHYVV